MSPDDPITASGSASDAASTGWNALSPSKGTVMDAIPVDLHPSTPFTIARGTKRIVPNVIIRLTRGDVSGYGEAGPNARYQEDQAAVLQVLDGIRSDVFTRLDTRLDSDGWEGLRVFGAGVVAEHVAQVCSSLGRPPVHAASLALEVAWLDLRARQQGRPLWELLDLAAQASPPVTPSNSFTIGLDTPEQMAGKIRARPATRILKIKLGRGVEQDLEIMKVIRDITDLPIRVDANEGWTELKDAMVMVEKLYGMGVEMVEQPMPSHMEEEMAVMKRHSPLPLYADEAFTGSESLRRLADGYHGVNVKLMKVGGLLKALQLQKEARKLGLLCMTGCMIESSVGIAAGALLGIGSDIVDLDGHLLIDNDPFTGLVMDDQDRIHLSDTPGLGVRPVDAAFGQTTGSAKTDTATSD